jgi:transposase
VRGSGEVRLLRRTSATTLHAALDVISGKVIGSCTQRQRQQEYIEFLKLVDNRSPKGKVLHLILDNASSHRTKSVREYLGARAGRFVVQHTPTHSSWLNLVERWFAEITRKRIRRGSWASVKQLERAITEYIHTWNASGRRFVWTKDSDEILRKVRKVVAD